MSARRLLGLPAVIVGLLAVGFFAPRPQSARANGIATLGLPVPLTHDREKPTAPAATLGKPVAISPLRPATANPTFRAVSNRVTRTSYVENNMFVFPPAHPPYCSGCAEPVLPPFLDDCHVPCSAVRPLPMIGDLPGYQSYRQMVIKTSLSDPAASHFGQVTDQFAVHAPLPNRGSFKIADNESPVPMDRAYVTYNYFQGLPIRVLGQSSTLTLASDGNSHPLRSTRRGTLNGTAEDPLSSLNNTTISTAGLHREVLGIEKTFMDGTVSVGLRLPFYHLNQNLASVPDVGRLYAFNGGPTSADVVQVSNGLDSGGIGDLSILVKIALLNDVETGSVLSTGLMTTTPSGESATLDGHKLRTVLLQPFFGWLTTIEDWYLQGFSSIVIGSDDVDPTMFVNDFGIGYVWRVGSDADLLRAIIPTLECHVTTPLRQGNGKVLQMPDVVTLTGGIHFDLAEHSLLTVGAGTPLTGIRPYSFQVAVYYNWRY